MCFLPSIDTAQYASHPPTRRSALARFSYRIQKAFTLHFGYTPLPTALLDELDGFRGLGTAPRFAVEDFVDILLCGYREELALPEAVVESVIFYRCATRATHSDVVGEGEEDADPAFLVCHLRHPDAPRFRISLMLAMGSDRQLPSNASSAPRPNAVLKLSIMTTDSHAHLIGEAHLECRSLSFPPGGPRAAPTIMDILALAQLVSERKPNLKDMTIDRSATVVCAALEEIFGGLSKDELGRANELGLDTKTTLDDDDSYDEKEVGAVVDGFPSKRSQLQSRMDRVRRHGDQDPRLAALQEETAALKAELAFWTEEAVRLELKLAAALDQVVSQIEEFVGDGLVVMSARRK
ncbi:hypothetical protein FB451DRAFT_1235209 [Mycena latifolia]|nr:hypothetical protein FB451DRAFT_1235209 [Mycena latifolia]